MPDSGVEWLERAALKRSHSSDEEKRALAALSAEDVAVPLLLPVP